MAAGAGGLTRGGGQAAVLGQQATGGVAHVGGAPWRRVAAAGVELLLLGPVGGKDASGLRGAAVLEPLGELAGGVVLVGGAPLVKAGFLDQAVAAVVGKAGAVVVLVGEDD